MTSIMFFYIDLQLNLLIPLPASITEKEFSRQQKLSLPLSMSRVHSSFQENPTKNEICRVTLPEQACI